MSQASGGWKLPWGTEDSGTQRELSLETLRGLAILLMVSGHVIGLEPNRGLRVADDSAWRYFTESLVFLRMPLFTVISGYVYAMRPLRPGPGKLEGFLRGKARRLLIPLVTISTVQFLFKASMPNVHDRPALLDLFRIYFYPFDQFWFIQALTLVFLTVGVLEAYGLMRTLRPWLACFAVSSAAFFLAPRPLPFFSFQAYLQLLPYFLIGLGAWRFAGQLNRTPVTLGAAALFVASFGEHQLHLLQLLEPHGKTSLAVGAVIGASGCFLLLKSRVVVVWLAWVGSYAYTIYLLHILPMSGSRIVLRKLGLEHDVALFAAGMLAAVLGPIVMDRLLRRAGWTRTLFLGLRAERKPPPSQPKPRVHAMEAAPPELEGKRASAG